MGGGGLLLFFVPSIVLTAPPSPPSPYQTRMPPHPTPYPLFEVPSPSLRSYTVLPFLCLSECHICQPRSSPPPAAATGATDAFIVLLFLTLTLLHSATSHLPPAQEAEPWDLSRGGFHPLLTSPFKSLSSPHPGALSLRNGRCRGPWQSGTQSSCCKKKNVLSGARGNQCRWGVCLRASFAVRFDSYFFFLMIFLYGWVWGVDELNECMSWGAWTWECAHNNMLTVRVVALSQWFMRVCCEGSSEQDIVPWLVTSASLSLCVCV